MAATLEAMAAAGVSCNVGPGRLGPYHLAAADFNGDGRIDIVTQNREDTISVLLNSG